MATLGEYLGAGSSTTKGLWHLNGNSTDSSGNGNNGTDTGITYSQANGKFGQGAFFNNNGTSKTLNSANSYILIPTSSELSPGTGDYTVSMWFKSNDTRKERDIQVLNMYGSNTLNTYQIGYKNSGYLFGYLRDGNGNFIDCIYNVDIIDGKWRNIILVRDGTTGYLYIDGNLVDESTNASLGNIDTSSSYDLYLGTYGTAKEQGGSFYGYIDEVIIEKKAWTDSEVKKYYTYAKGKFGII